MAAAASSSTEPPSTSTNRRTIARPSRLPSPIADARIGRTPALSRRARVPAPRPGRAVPPTAAPPARRRSRCRPWARPRPRSRPGCRARSAGLPAPTGSAPAARHEPAAAEVHCGDQSQSRDRPTSSKVEGATPAEPRGWSLYGAPWLQPVAIIGKSTGPRNRKNKRNPLPSAATGCLGKYMVRRGSTVRVRQRALQKPRKAGLLLSVALAQSPECSGYGALYGAFRSKTPSAP